MQLKKKVITAEDIKITFLRTEETEHTLSALFEYHNEKEKHKLNNNTLSHYETSQRYLIAFVNKRYKKKDLSLKDVNYKFIADFENFLRDYKPEGNKKAIGNTGAVTHLIRLKKMLNLALALEWLHKNPFINYKIKIQHKEREFLSKAELARMEKTQFTIPRLDFVRDVFVFCCYTGLAYVDAFNLTAAQLVTGVDEKQWIKTLRQKTKTQVTTPLLSRAAAILAKYKDDKRAISAGKLFPVMSNQKMNSYLKEIADLYGISKNLTFHLARHTFATTVTLSNGVPIETVSKILGHAKMGTTQIYAKVIEQKISDDMSALQKRLS